MPLLLLLAFIVTTLSPVSGAEFAVQSLMAEKMHSTSSSEVSTPAASPNNQQPYHFDLKSMISKENLKVVLLVGFRISAILGLLIGLWIGINRLIGYQLGVSSSLKKLKYFPVKDSEPSAIIKTLAPIIRSACHWGLIIMASLMILVELNINIIPIIYSFSVIGLAVGFGAQTLVKDLINGFLTLIEGNMAVGEKVTIGIFSGVVESISLRCILLRHDTGELQTIPFSEVTSVINRSRDYSIAIIQFTVDFRASLTKVYEALRKTYQQLQSDPVFGPMIKENLQISGVTKFTDIGIQIGAYVKITSDPNKTFVNAFNTQLQQNIVELDIPTPLNHLLLQKI
jgi:small conductance mechanosensitive channel